MKVCISILAALGISVVLASSCQKEPKAQATVTYQFTQSMAGVSTGKTAEVLEVLRGSMKSVASADKGYYDRETDILKFYDKDADGMPDVNRHNTLIREKMRIAESAISEMDLGKGASVKVTITSHVVPTNADYTICEFTVSGHTSAAEDVNSTVCGFGTGSDALEFLPSSIQIEENGVVIPVSIVDQKPVAAYKKYFVTCTENDATKVVTCDASKSGDNAGSLKLTAHRNGKAHLTLSLADANGTVMAVKHITVTCRGNYLTLKSLGTTKMVKNCGLYHDTTKHGYNFVATTDDLVNLDKCAGDKSHVYVGADFPEKIVGKESSFATDILDTEAWSFAFNYCLGTRILYKSMTSKDFDNGSVSCYIYADGLVEVDLDSVEMSAYVSCYPDSYTHYIWGEK